MAALLNQYLDQFLVFVLVLTRVGALTMALPFIGSQTVPMQVRALLAVAMAVIITSSIIVPNRCVGVKVLRQNTESPTPAIMAVCAIAGATPPYAETIASWRLRPLLSASRYQVRK